MKRVVGIGGVFFKAKDAPALQHWYKTHLGVDVQPWGGAVFPGTGTDRYVAWSIDPQDSASYEPSASPFRINYVVEDLKALIEALKNEGCQVAESVEESEYGLFGWVIDPEGNKVELWQP